MAGHKQFTLREGQGNASATERRKFQTADGALAGQERAPDVAILELVKRR